ncbi:hypothetical protein H5410_053492 [Solanum commersonii]|uniref:laccase n=1 Tax=Solanum commersonii TaxID=4109 RepID=A0A9J5X3M8_SOLCO|nr:hypothetical protein H5410_053492 [Solanum commersonii]
MSSSTTNPPLAPMTMFIIVFLALCLISQPTQAITRHYEFNITMQNVTRLCHTKSIVTVNGKFPGPPIVTREGDHLLIKVTNHVPNNITLHWYNSLDHITLNRLFYALFWKLNSFLSDPFFPLNTHGVRQLRNGWADGPAYITQCPVQSGQTYVYNYTIIGQRGALWWHAHISWLKSTLYGPLIILPKKNVSYPFVKPYKEVPIIFGEWFNTDPEDIISQALQSGGGPNVSDAYTINDTFKLKVKPGKTYLLRMINAALNDELFFSIANHTLTVVEADALYVKPFDTKTVLITPGQTTNVLLKTKSKYPNATFLMFARPYVTGQGTFDNSTVAGILEYESPTPHSTKSNLSSVELIMQDTSILGVESHPLHLHGFNILVVGQGFGNFDSNKDPAKFNLVDPVERNTIGVPSGRWVAIRFLADNLG